MSTPHRPRALGLPLTLAIVLALGACAQDDERQSDARIAAEESAAATTDDSAMAETPGATPPVTTGTPVPSGAASMTLALEGLGSLAIGKPVPAGSSFAERGAQTGDDCRTISSPDYPGVYAITKGRGGPVRRITVGQRSDVKLIEGIGVGATEKEVLAAFPGFRSSPHKYVDAPGKYLTQPGNDPRLRFEIGADGRASLIHVGVMRELGYVAGCA